VKYVFSINIVAFITLKPKSEATRRPET